MCLIWSSSTKLWNTTQFSDLWLDVEKPRKYSWKAWNVNLSITHSTNFKTWLNHVGPCRQRFFTTHAVYNPSVWILRGARYSSVSIRSQSTRTKINIYTWIEKHEINAVVGDKKCGWDEDLGLCSYVVIAFF